MYFVFSKVLLFLITPFWWICFLLIMALFSKRPKLKKRLFITSLAVFLIFSSPLLLRLFARCWNYPPNYVNGKYSCAIVLGGFASEKSDGSGYFNPACDRFIEGTELKTTGTVSHILISSGNSGLRPDGFREADWVKKELLKFNVPDTAILIEHGSRNTFENAEFSKKILTIKHLSPPYLLVTGAFHMRRAMHIFKKAGIPVIPYPSEYSAVYDGLSIGDLIPQPEILSGWNIYTKEVIGYIVSVLK